MTDPYDELDSLIHAALEEFPQAAVPSGFRSAVLSRIVLTPPAQSLAPGAPAAGQSGTGFLELTGALLMGVFLSGLLLFALLLAGIGPEGWDLPAFPSLPALPADWALSWRWLLPALAIMAVELVLVILAGLLLVDAES